MALTTLDPITALIVVDLQKGLVSSTSGSSFIHPIADVVARACGLIGAFRQAALLRDVRCAR